jgi:hypothetical protein
VFCAQPSWTYGGYAALELEARNLPLVIAWVGVAVGGKVNKL